MFIPFIFELRRRNVPVGTHEAIALAEAMSYGLHRDSLDGFYYLARALLIHDEIHMDQFDEAFLAHFLGIQGKGVELKKELLDWLKQAEEHLDELTPEQLAFIKELDLEELRKMFEETMQEQTERHDGGDRWVGTHGRSPYGHSGAARPGIRVGGPGKHRSAVQVADARQYRPYRADLTLDVRQMQIALRRLRSFVREGVKEELDIEASIDATAKNAGELEIITRATKHPNTRVILMMDVGGSMDPHRYLVSRLFTAARKTNNFKELRCYYFHNCVYGRVYRTDDFDKPVTVRDLLRECDSKYKLIMVGDALMAPYELHAKGGALSYNEENNLPGFAWLSSLQQHFKRSVWLNPEPVRFWEESTIQDVRCIFEMFPLTLDGLTHSMAYLNKPSKMTGSTS
jgi:uncharacterized protein with von Willebrand factor type A (vWA) domain